jgi:hypothetical protein
VSGSLAALPQGKMIPNGQKAGGRQNRSGRCGEDKNLLTTPGI